MFLGWWLNDFGCWDAWSQRFRPRRVMGKSQSLRTEDRTLTVLSLIYVKYEEFSAHTKPTDKPHTKLDVLRGIRSAGTQSPTRWFSRNMLKGPFGQVDPMATKRRKKWNVNLAGLLDLCVSSQISLTASNSHWGKRVCQKQAPSLATIASLLAGKVPVRFGGKSSSPP